MPILRNSIAAACLMLIPYTLVDEPASGRGSRADLASRIDEYMTANREAELFMGSVLVARGGQVLVSKGMAWPMWSTRSSIRPRPGSTSVHSTSNSRQS
jgi:hypothetical protein